MGQYRKKPVVIEATQWFKEGDHPAVRMSRPWGDPARAQEAIIDTLEGVMIVAPGDWIITGVKGEHYPCKPDIFAATYEPAERAPAAVEADAIVADCAELPGSLGLAIAIQRGGWPHTMDAEVWADKFAEALKKWPNIAHDRGALIGWFANAIMAGYDAGRRHEAQERDHRAAGLSRHPMAAEADRIAAGGAPACPTLWPL